MKPAADQFWRDAARRGRASVGRLGQQATGPFALDVGTSMVSSVVSIVGSGLQAVIIAKAFGPEGKGLVTLTFLLPGLLAPLVGAGFNASFLYFATRMPLQRSVEHVLSFTLTVSALGLAVVGILGVTGALHQIAPELHGTYLVLACAALPLTVALSAHAALLSGLGRVRQVNIIRIGQVLGSLILVALIIAVFDSPTWVVAAMVFSIAGAWLAQLRLISREGAVDFRLGFSRESARLQGAYGAKVHAGQVLQVLNYRVDQLFVNAYLNSTQLGLYSVAVTLAEALWIIPGAIAEVLFPRVASAQTASSRTLKVFLASMAVSAVCALGLVVLGGPTIGLLFGAKFRHSADALRWLLPGAMLLGPAKILAADLAGRGYPLIASGCSGVAFLVTVVLDVLLIPSHGIIGASFASSAAYAAYALLAFTGFVVVSSRHESGDGASTGQSPE